MSNDLTTVQKDYLAVMPVMDIATSRQRRSQVVEFVKSIMVEDTDFGIIPGTDKATLLKPGAEKLTTFFGLTKKFEIVERVEDWTGEQHGGEPFFYYLYRCQLWRGDLLVAESDGSCNSHESKYRWRWAGEDDIPPYLDRTTLKRRGGTVSEFTFAVDKAETGGKYGKPAEYWQRFKDAIDNGTARKISKKISSGKEYDAWEIGSDVYRIPNDDIASQVNTIQKMAQKRALIAATLLAVNASEFFTQDLEDYVEGDFTPVADTPAPKQNGHSAPAPKPDTKPVRPVPVGSNDIPNRPQDLLDLVNRRVVVPYDNIFHIQKALQNELGDNWKWPRPDDTDGWLVAYETAMAHAIAKEAQEPAATEPPRAEQDEMPF